MGRPQNADQNFVRAKDPQIGTQKCSTKRGVREPLKAKLALNYKKLVKTNMFDLSKRHHQYEQNEGLFL